MSKLEELIQQYCPDGVEYLEIREIAQVGTGSSNGNEAEEGGVFPFFVRSQTVKRKNDYEYDEEAIIIPGEGGIGDIFHYIKGKYALHQRVYRIHFTSPSINVKFAFYYMKSAFKQFILMKAVSATVTSIRKPMIESFPLPVPPLPVQEEIVRILDTFTELQAELQAELQKRKQQYNYYRDYLLSFEGRTDVEWKKLGEIASIKTGRRFVRTDIRESGVPCFHYGDIYTYYGLTATKTKGYLDEELAKKLRFAQPNDVVVVCAGENDMDIGVGVAWLGDEPAVVHDACCILHHNQSPRYISHFLRTHNYHLQMKKYVKNGKISSLPASGLAEALIPLPSLEEQERIASILDRFDSLTNDLAAGLPAEIEKRRQQYEYYRDKLLTFKRKGA